MGRTSFAEVTGNDIVRRVTANECRTLSEHFPEVDPGCLLDGKGPIRLQELWDRAGTNHVSTGRWIILIH
jgi:hypothetical protein